MRNVNLRTIFSILFLGGCSSSTHRSSDGSISPTQAIVLAADAAPAGVRGTFEMEARSAGRQDGNIYLDSELDYRDQRNLTIAVHPAAAVRLREKFGKDIDSLIIGKRIMINGEARRVKIVISFDGRLTGDYYYQTHVDVWDAGQLSILP